jgi:segregation and condensation protein B
MHAYRCGVVRRSVAVREVDSAGRGPQPPAGDADPTPLARLETALWGATGPLSSRRLAKLARLSSPADADALVGRLRERLAARRSALDVAKLAGGYRLLTRPALAPWIARGVGEAESPAISGPALETLAVVAYRQPALRAEVEAVRGVGCGELLRQLLESDLLRIVGRSGELGKPLLYGTTDRFLELFGLGSLDDLPSVVEGAAPEGPTKAIAPQTLAKTRLAA